MTRALPMLLLLGCFPALERPPALIDGDGDGFVGADDCDDGDEAISPDADEVCNDADEDCDGRVDEDLPAVWYPDDDSDGVGASVSPYQGCDPPEGYVESTGDCNDADDAIVAAEIWYPDLDGDGYGDSRSGVSTCEPPEGWLRDGSDCDDSSADVSPEGTEVCDANDVDEDCDGLADDLDPEGADGTSTWRVDGDGDGYGAGTPVSACDAPDDTYAAGPEDCDDSDPDLTPDTVWYWDGDGDGYGTTATGDTGCTNPGGAAPLAGDCADGDSTRNPGAEEVCDSGSVDEDCDGFANESDPEGATGEQVYYEDSDSDGYGSELSATVFCTDPGGTWTLDGGDCDDANDAVSPDESEVCDDEGVDEDCDGFANAEDPEGASGSLSLYPDADGDTYGETGAAPTSSCDPIEGTASRDGDCDDSDPLVNPETTWCPDGDGDGWGDNSASPEVACAPSDTSWVSNCADCDDDTASQDPEAQWYIDSDFDNFGADDTLVEQCTQPAAPETGQWVAIGGDCLDSDPNTFPGAPETCQDGVVNDCDSTTDDDLCLPGGLVALDELSTVIYGQGLGHFAGASLTSFQGQAGTRLAIGSPGVPRTHHRAIGVGETQLRALGGGYTGDSNLGIAMAPLGDSVVIGESGSDAVYVVPGELAIPRDASAQASATLVGPANTGAGAGVVTGDFNGDGVDDIIVCAPNGTTSVSTDGGAGNLLVYARLWVVPGPVSGTVTLSAAGAGGYTLPLSGPACAQMAAVRDLGGDGAEELVVGLPDQEQVVVFSGAKLAAGLALPTEFVISTDTPGRFGQAVAVGEDASTSPLAVGAPDAGVVMLYDLRQREELAQIAGGTGFGAAVSLPGDLDNDGEEDLAVAAPLSGALYVVDGASIVSGDQTVSGRLIVGLEASETLGLLPYGGHDVNNDGRDDLVIAAPNYGDDRGRLWVLYGVP